MLLSFPPTASAQLNLGVPEEVKGVDIIEHLEAQLPLDTRFTSDTGEQVRLGDYFLGGKFGGEKPVLLQLGYNKCPMLCNLVLNGAFRSFGVRLCLWQLHSKQRHAPGAAVCPWHPSAQLWTETAGGWKCGNW